MRDAVAGCTPPINEDCEDAIVFETADLPFSVTAPLGCVNDVIDKPYFDIFYRFDCQRTAVHFIDMCDSDGDTYLRIYGGGCGWVDGEELAVADDECPGSPPNADPSLSILLEAGQSYWFELGTWRAEPPWAPPPNSPYHFTVSVESGPVAGTCDGVDIPTRIVADPGNPADGNGRGAVSEFFRLARFEITNRQYVDFLNSIAASDPNGLYDVDMTDSDRGGILRTGVPGSFVYFVKQSFGDKPANFVTWSDAARFCNWLHNGAPTGAQDSSTTEFGAYDMTLALNQIARLPGATWFMPTHDEWYKAAYYDADTGGGAPGYWEYPTRSNSLPSQASADSEGNVTNPGLNIANYDGGADWNGENGNVTTVGGTTSEGPWGHFDLGGNVLDMTETLDNPIPPDTPTRTARGGDFSNAGILMSSPEGFAIALNMEAAAANAGIRVAAVVCTGDFDGDGDLDDTDFTSLESCFTGPGGVIDDSLCSLADFDGDGDVDCLDVDAFRASWTLEGPAPALELCNAVPALSSWGITVMLLMFVVWGSVVYRAPGRTLLAAGRSNQCM
ncbi:MAG: formylglycine-generating enzyme family protein [Planctomycetota bacterium]|jgi:formylglycine-generating enzyme required for sulfatase activity